LYQRNGLALALALAASLAVFLGLVLGTAGAASSVAGRGDFFDVFSHNQLVAIFVPVFLFIVFSLGKGVRRFWQDITPATSGAALSVAATAEASTNALTLKYLGGGHGEGCNNADDAWTLARRRTHHLTFYGFMLCFAATGLATVYHYVLGWHAPYDLPSLPKVLGVAGGISMLVGTVGLGWLNLTRHSAHGDAAQKTMDLGFIALLFLTSASGMALWLARSTGAMPVLLATHLGVVMALFLTLPYGKFAHGVYRMAALLRDAVEKRQPSTLALGAD
jgi:citrate/tricarballylate utilization protein